MPRRSTSAAPKFLREGAPPAHETHVRRNEICTQNEIAPSAKSSRNDALRHRGPRHRSAAVMSSHLTVGVRAAFELHSSRRGVPSQASENPTVFNSAADWAAVPTGEAHRLPKKCAGFIGGTGGSQGRLQQKRSLPATSSTQPCRQQMGAAVPICKQHRALWWPQRPGRDPPVTHRRRVAQPPRRRYRGSPASHGFDSTNRNHGPCPARHPTGMSPAEGGYIPVRTGRNAPLRT